ncbi:uncharacterized protein LOC120150551 [Hibiscus syriacus]|uniref:uncharacterized protein LOC120150551 n=1 Tax=Hibiscus syriacus TaxID=106335 RepID=UPI0019213DE9|nr:uncharacterized protein LOC120150551 [Hibiscus syriacus]
MGQNIAHIHHLHQNHDEDAEEEEEEEAISDTKNNPENDLLVKVSGTRRSLSEAAPEFFEFISDLSFDMCPADDIIFCGKLIPLNQQTPKDYSFEETRKTHVLHKRSESLSDLPSESITRSEITKDYTKILRNSRSLDYRKLRRYDMERNTSTRSARKPEASAMKVNKRR